MTTMMMMQTMKLYMSKDSSYNFNSSKVLLQRCDLHGPLFHQQSHVMMSLHTSKISQQHLLIRVACFHAHALTTTTTTADYVALLQVLCITPGVTNLLGHEITAQTKCFGWSCIVVLSPSPWCKRFFALGHHWTDGSLELFFGARGWQTGLEPTDELPRWMCGFSPGTPVVLKMWTFG